MAQDAERPAGAKVAVATSLLKHAGEATCLAASLTTSGLLATLLRTLPALVAADDQPDAEEYVSVPAAAGT